MPIENVALPLVQPWLRHNPSDHGLTYVYSFVGDGKENALLKYYVRIGLELFSRFGFTFIYKDKLDESQSHIERQLTFNTHPERCYARMIMKLGDIARIECNIQSKLIGSKFDSDAIIHELFHGILGELHQQQHPHARDIYHIGKKDSINIDPYPSNDFINGFHSESIMMYPSYYLGASLYNKQKIIDALQNWGFNSSAAEKRADFIAWYETIRPLPIIPQSDLQAIETIGHFIHPELEKNSVPLVALTDVLSGGQDIPLDPAKIFQYLKMFKEIKDVHPAKLHTLNKVKVQTFSAHKNQSHCFELNLEEQLRLINNSGKWRCELISHNPNPNAILHPNATLLSATTLDNDCKMQLDTSKLFFGFYHDNLTVKTSHEPSNSTGFRTIEWLHYQNFDPIVTNRSCLSAPLPHKTSVIQSTYHSFEAVINWPQVDTFLKYYFSQLEIPFYVGLGNGFLQASIEKGIKYEISKQKPLNFLIWLISCLAFISAQIISSHSFIEREYLIRKLFSIQDQGFIYDTPELDRILEKIDADNFTELLIPHLVATVSIVFSRLFFISRALVNKKSSSSKNQYFLSNSSVILGNAVANLVICGNPYRLINGSLGMLSYLAGDFSSKLSLLLLGIIINNVKPLSKITTLFSAMGSLLMRIYFWTPVLPLPMGKVEEAACNTQSHARQPSVFSAMHKAWKSISRDKFCNAAHRFFPFWNLNPRDNYALSDKAGNTSLRQRHIPLDLVEKADSMLANVTIQAP